MEQFITRIQTNLNGVLEMTQIFDGLMMTGDNLANRIIVEMHRDGIPVPVPEGASIVGYIIRNDGYTLDIPGGVIEEGHAYIDVPNLAYAATGPLSIAIRMILGEYKIVIATATCYVNLTETNSIIDTSHRIPDVEELLSHLEEIDAAQAAIVEAEAARVEAEAARVEAEESRQQDYEALIDDIDDAEYARATAEAARASAETDRISAETARLTAETGRATAETAREQAQALRNAEIDGMTVEATALDPYADPTATITEVNGHKHIVFGLRPGDPFVIQKVFSSVAEMNAYSGTDIRVGQFAVIASTVEDEDNAKMFVKTGSGYSFITDLSGAQGLTGPRGFTGNGISSAVLNQDYTLTIYYTDGTSYTTATPIRGVQGETGNGIASAVLNQDYTLTISFTDGTSYTTPTPIRGLQGADGKGIASVVFNNDYTMTITFTDGTAFTTPPLKGEAGAAGTNFVFDSEEQSLTVVYY